MNGPDALDVVLMLAAAALILAVFLGIFLALAQARRRHVAAQMVAVAEDDPLTDILPAPRDTFADSGGSGGGGGDGD